jgi:hypothetical protein
VDTRDSFRVYVNNKKEVRFRCFGACNTEWDVYNLIMLRKKYGFTEAQIELARTLGEKDFEVFSGKVDQVSEQQEKPEESETLMEPEVLAPEIIEALERAAEFYIVSMKLGFLDCYATKKLQDYGLTESILLSFLNF